MQEPECVSRGIYERARECRGRGKNDLFFYDDWTYSSF